MPSLRFFYGVFFVNVLLMLSDRDEVYSKSFLLKWGGWSLLLGGAGLVLACISYVSVAGVGVLGCNQSVFWGWDIVNFVFWIGLGHAGTLISAVLLLTRQAWRCSVARLAEAMTLFAILCAAIYPLFHIGRVWLSWYFLPLPSDVGLWPNFLSPLMWDAFAVGTYFCISVMFFYVSFVPDLSTVSWIKASFLGRSFVALWKGTPAQFEVRRRVILWFACLLTPLVVSVHSIVSYDFAVTTVRGWNWTMFPPYFVMGAILGGLAMVMLVLVVLKSFVPEWGKIPQVHINSLAKLLLGMSCAMGGAYMLEWDHAPQMVWSEGGKDFFVMIVANVVIPQILWIPRCRRMSVCLVLVALSVSLGMWWERLFIVVRGSEASYLVAASGSYTPSFVDLLWFVGTLSIFFGCVSLFVFYFPSIEQESYPDNKKMEKHSMVDACFIQKERICGKEAIRQDDLLFSLKAMKIKVIVGGVLGGCLCAVFLYLTQLMDYPLVLQGRPAEVERFIGFVPVIFECFILGAGITAFIQCLLAWKRIKVAEMEMRED